MNGVFRFNEYEVLAYVATGLAAILVTDLVFDSHWILGARWSVSEGVAVALAAYVVGQIIASSGAWLLEHHFVRSLLGAPSKTLFSEAPPTGTIARVKRRLFPGYFKPLERSMQERVKAKMREEGHPLSSGETLFWVAFARTKRDPHTYGRMASFLKLYGFCRNIAFVGLIAAVLLTSKAIWLVPQAAPQGEILDRLMWATVALIAGLVMLYRYLKFYRLYTVEIFTGYVELPSSEG